MDTLKKTGLNSNQIKVISHFAYNFAGGITGKEKWFKKCFMPMAITEDNITEDILQTAKLSIDYMKVKTAMPSNVDKDRMKKCKAPAFVMGAEKDCLFPGPKVIKMAERIIPNCKTYLLKGRGHMHFLTDDEKKMIVEFCSET